MLNSMNISRRSLLGAAAAIASGAGVAGRASAQSTGGRPVKIGVLGDFSSSYANMSGLPVVEAVRLAVEDFGSSVLGQPVEVVYGDTRLKPDVASGIAREWFDVGGVDAVIDLPGSAMAIAVMDVALSHKKIVFPTASVSSDITGKYCTPYTAQWTYDTYSIAHSTVPGVIGLGGDSWFFVTLDTITGLGVEQEMTEIVIANGGKVLGSVRVPAGTDDMASFLLRAQSSNAKVLSYSLAGSDGSRLVKQASEFGLVQSGRMLVGSFVQTDDLRGIGLNVAKGLIYASAFDWNLNDETRAFAKRFFPRAKVMPNQNMASAYSAISHYLKAIAAVGSQDADQVMAKMRDMPVNDVFAKNGRLRMDGRMSHGMYVMQAKDPSESQNEWDVSKALKYIEADVAVRPLAAGGCKLVT
jgi:branched-chain amino acid transport system substrate-binding protein